MLQNSLCQIWFWTRATTMRKNIVWNNFKECYSTTDDLKFAFASYLFFVESLLDYHFWSFGFHFAINSTCSGRFKILMRPFNMNSRHSTLKISWPYSLSVDHAFGAEIDCSVEHVCTCSTPELSTSRHCTSTFSHVSLAFKFLCMICIKRLIKEWRWFSKKRTWKQ